MLEFFKLKKKKKHTHIFPTRPSASYSFLYPQDSAVPSRHSYLINVEVRVVRGKDGCCSRQQSSAPGVGDSRDSISTVSGDGSRQDSLGSL